MEHQAPLDRGERKEAPVKGVPTETPVSLGFPEVEGKLAVPDLLVVMVTPVPLGPLEVPGLLAPRVSVD